jgi:tRNA pseudouridine38-40 synthase
MKSVKIRRVAFGVAYCGVSYAGFQLQPNLETVEKHLLFALEKISGEKLQIHCAGRTDTGVHALCQVIHIDTTILRDSEAWIKGVNAFLPADIQVHWVKYVDDGFHARFSAKSRSYIYYLCDQDRHLFEQPYIWYTKSLNVDAMHQASQILLGEHDFRAFQSKICQSSVSYRNMMNISVRRENGVVRVDLTANAFLHRMVRKIVASLVAIGDGRVTQQSFKAAFEAGDRSKVPGQAPAKALFLSNVCYGEDIEVLCLEEFLGR